MHLYLGANLDERCLDKQLVVCYNIVAWKYLPQYGRRVTTERRVHCSAREELGVKSLGKAESLACETLGFPSEGLVETCRTRATSLVYSRAHDPRNVRVCLVSI